MASQQRLQRGQWLIAALENDRLQRAEELIRQGADLSVCGPDSGNALYTALAYRHFPLVRLLLDFGADPNVPGPRGTYPLHLAAADGGDEHAPALIEALREHGARIEVRDEEGATPLFLAGKFASVETIQALLRHGGDINDRNRELDTPLTFACCHGMTERARRLLELGIDLHARDDGKMTALSWAAHGGHVDTIALLLQCGAEVDVVDHWGRTPLILASCAADAPSIALLLDAGADLGARDARGWTAFDYAQEHWGPGRPHVRLLSERARSRGRERPGGRATAC